MALKRGDIVPVVLSGPYGKPRPAIIVQSNFFNEHPSVTIVPVTGEVRDLPLFRLRIHPSEKNGLKKVSDIMIDKIHTTPREKIGKPFGHLEHEYLTEMERLMVVFLGLAS